MEISEYVLLGLVVVTGVYLVTIYNNLVRLKHTVTKNWSNIDVLISFNRTFNPRRGGGARL